MRRALLGLSLGAALAVGACAPHVEVPGLPSESGIWMTDSAIHTYDGLELPLRAWRPKGQTKAVLIALHGFNDYGKSWETPGQFWASQGLATYAYDQRGFGQTDQPGLWHGGQTLVEDLKDVVTLLRRRHPGLPVFVVGESMGGAVAMIAMADSEPPLIDGLILSAPAVWGRSTMNLASRTGLWALSHSVPWLRLSGKGLNIKASDNMEMLRALSKDPLVIKETRIDAIHGLVDLMDSAQAAAGNIRVPTLVLYGEKDEIVPPEATDKMIAHLHHPGDFLSVAIYPQGYHMLMRDLQAEIVLKDVVAWVAHHDQPLPSGAERSAVRQRVSE